MAMRPANRQVFKGLLAAIFLTGLALPAFGTAEASAAGTTPQTISFSSTPPSNAIVGGPAYTVAATASSGLPVELSIDPASASVCALSGSTSGSNVSFQAHGTCAIDANQAGNGTFEPAPQVQQSFSVFGKAQTISFGSTPPTTATVGGAPYMASATASSGLSVIFTVEFSSESVCSISGSTVSFIGAGTCAIDADQPGDAEYAQAPEAQQSFTVGRAPEGNGQTNEPTSGPAFTFQIPVSETFVGQSGNQNQEHQAGPTSNVVRVIAERPNKRSGGEILVVKVSGPGVLSAREASSGRAKHSKRKGAPVLVKPVSVTVGKAGKATLQISPTKAGSSELKRKHRLSVKVLITFTPTGGTPGTIVKTLVFGARPGGHR